MDYTMNRVTNSSNTVEALEITSPIRRGSQISNSRRMTEFHAYGVVSRIIGVCLLVAATLKGHALLNNYKPITSFLHSRYVEIATVEIELILGMWLITGAYRQVARTFAVTWFIILAAVSAYLVTEGNECCGCLGSLSINPWYTFGFNLSAICLLVLCQLNPKDNICFALRPLVTLVSVCIVVFVSVVWLFALPENRLVTRVLGHSTATAESSDEIVIVEPEAWLGKSLPYYEVYRHRISTNQRQVARHLFSFEVPKV